MYCTTNISLNLTRRLNQQYSISYMRFFHNQITTSNRINTEQLNVSSLSPDIESHRQNENHTPVMVKEVVENLQPNPNQTIIDMTFGGGGHSKALLKLVPSLKIIAVDRDPEAYEIAVKLSEQYHSNQILPLLSKFSELPKLFKQHNIAPNSIDGILFDFGCSSMQFDQAHRGFALSKNGPLDMRMDKDRLSNQITATDLLANINEIDLAKILKIYGDEKHAKKIAQAIVDVRYAFKKIETTFELAEVVRSCFPDKYRLDKLQRPSHVATKTFQAIRIFINDELNEINYGLNIAKKYLKLNGRIVTLTFHSLEDTIVKRHISGNLIGNIPNPYPLKYSSHAITYDNTIMDTIIQSNWKSLHKHVLIPTDEEIQQNPRSRSAKLRAAIRIN